MPLQYKNYQTTSTWIDKCVINTDDKILKEAKSFYQKLYSSCKPQSISDYDDIFCPEGSTGTLEEHVRKECEGLLT